jgi:hypothetical protein
MMRRVVALTLAGALLSALAVAGLVFTSRAAPTFDVLNANAYATADHERAGNDAFPNFANGAVDNRYPLAFARVDLSSAEGIASPLDTGPIGQTGAAAAGVTQPQYADAKYPPAGPAQTVGAAGGPYGLARAKSDDGFAQASAAGTPTDVPSRASAERLRAALGAWRAEFLTADDAARHPFLAASDPDGEDGLTGLTHTSFDSARGVLTVDADGRVARAAFGGGAIVFHGIRMHVTITNDGSPKHVISAEIASAEVGGVPVHVGADGVTVDTTEVPGVAGAIDQANQSLNSALASAGFAVFALAPAITKGTNLESIEVSAVRVRWSGGDVAPGVPRSFVEHDLGEAFAFSLATPSSAVPSTGINVPPVGAGPVTKFVPGTPGKPGTPGTSGQVNASAPTGNMSYGNAAHRTASNKPLWLLLLYFAWQTTMIGAVASLWWWRAEQRA